MNLKNFLTKVLFEKRWWFLLTGSNVTIEMGGILKIGKNVTIRNSHIYVKKGDCLTIGDNTKLSKVSINMIFWDSNEVQIGNNCSINDYNISATKGRIYIGDYNIFEKGNTEVKPCFEVHGTLRIGDYNRLRCSVWNRFNGQVQIGNRNAFNEGTEIRCDEQISIGDYNQISYDCVFWDTNTHNLYKTEERRSITDKQYPDFGLEYEKPKTAPIAIGNDCWIGKGVSILKGTNLADKCIVGYGALLSNVSVTENKTIFIALCSAIPWN